MSDVYIFILLSVEHQATIAKFDGSMIRSFKEGMTAMIK